MTTSQLRLTRTESDGAYAYFAFACAITWLLAFPLSLAWLRRAVPPSYALPLAGLSALGPTLAALLVAAPRRKLGEVFGRWRTNPLWVVLALFFPMAMHLIARGVDVALGAHPARWLYLPETSEHVAALVMFSIGEEFGWRGYAQPRMTERHGPVKGALIVGLVWAVWHLMYSVSQASGAFDLRGLGLALLELPLYSVVIAWVMERTNRSMAIAIAIHAGAHLDNINRGPAAELRFRVIHIAVVAVAAVFAARSLMKPHVARG